MAMSDRQLESTHLRDYQLTEHIQRRSLLSQVGLVLLQPSLFFRHLPAIQFTRQWVWIGLIVLALSGYSAVRHDALREEETSPGGVGASPADIPPAPDVVSGGGIDFGGLPPDVGGGPPADGAAPETGPSPEEVSATWSTGLEAAGVLILQWLVLAILLSEVSLLRGKAPRLGHNWQIAIWASVPLALMAGLQLVYFWAGGRPRQDGLSGVVDEWAVYQDLPRLGQSLMLSLASRFTLFWLWTLFLLYLGARYGLGGKWWSSGMVVVIWIAVLTLAPVATGSIEAPEEEDSAATDAVPPGDDVINPDNPEALPGVDITFGDGPTPIDGQGVEVAPPDMSGTAEPAESTEEPQSAPEPGLSATETPEAEIFEITTPPPGD
jgi:hypothetical protein